MLGAMDGEVKPEKSYREVFTGFRFGSHLQNRPGD